MCIHQELFAVFEFKNVSQSAFNGHCMSAIAGRKLTTSMLHEFVVNECAVRSKISSSVFCKVGHQSCDCGFLNLQFRAKEIWIEELIL